MDYNNEPPKIVFEGEQFQRPQSFQTPTPKIVGLVIKYSGGYIKDEKQASYVLIGFVVLAVIVSFLVVLNRGSRELGPKEKTFLDQGKSTESYDTKLFSQ